MQYKKTSKTLPVVAQELGVDYILEGTVRWVKTGNGGRIRITPQLIQVSGDVQLWADNIDRTMDDIFVIQTEIATRVVTSLDIVLAQNESNAVRVIPTKNLDAYQAYLRALHYPEYERSDLEKAIELLERAVKMDSTFALAYACLSRSHLRYFWHGFDRSRDRVALAKKLLDRAFELDGELPESYMALGLYYYFGFLDYDRAVEALTAAEKRRPNYSQAIASVGYVLFRQGKFWEAVDQLKRAFELDPQSAKLAFELGMKLMLLGEHAEAEAYFDRSIEITPSQGTAYPFKAWNYVLWKGDTKRGRIELERVPSLYHEWVDYAWYDILERNYESALNNLSRVSVSLYETQMEVTPIAQFRGLIYRYMKDTVRSRTAFDSARALLQSEVRKRPEDQRLHRSLGIIYAGLGRAEDAIREAQLAIEQLPISKDAYLGTELHANLVQVLIMIGRHDAALDQLDFLTSLDAPKVLTPALLRIDPMYDPLRENPRFQALLGKGE